MTHAVIPSTGETIPDAPSWAIEAAPGSSESVRRRLLGNGLSPVVQLPNISDIRGRDVLLAWGDVDSQALQVPGVLIAEGGTSLVYNGLPIPTLASLLAGAAPLSPDQALAVLLQQLPFNLRVSLAQGSVTQEQLSSAGIDPEVDNFFTERPLGARGLSVGPGMHNARSDDLDDILEITGVTRAWEMSRGEDQIIAVIDSGVEGIPAERRAGGWTNIRNGSPWEDDFGHGSMVARIALAAAPEAKVFSLRPAPDEKGTISSSSVYLGADHLIGWAVERQQRVVVNNSWAVGCISVFLPADTLATRMLTQLDNMGFSLLSWSAGNFREECGPMSVSVYTLASIPTSMATGAVGRQLSPLPYSGRGPGPDFLWQPSVCCPTYGVLPWGNGWVDFEDQGGGTSACAPIVAGTLAILASLFPDASGRMLRSAIRASASNAMVGLPGVPYHPLTGSGLLQAHKAIRAVGLMAAAHPSYILEALHPRSRLVR